MPLLQHLCQLLYDSHIGTAIRESDYAFSIIESVHVLGITLLVGTIALLDLRMLGLVLRPIPITRITRSLSPYMVRLCRHADQRLSALLG
jgi:hypothetical protein